MTIHQLIIDPDTLTLTWTDGVTAVRTVDLNVGCINGFTTTGWDFHAGTGFMGTYEAPDGEETNIQLGCNAVEPDKVCGVSFSWKDPHAQETYGAKIFNGMIGINTESRMITDFPGGLAGPRARSVGEEYRDEIWLGNGLRLR